MNIPQPDKTRFPAELARPISEELLRALTPFCLPDYCCVAGSLRREKPDVGDIEIVFVPRFERRAVPGEMFAADTDLASEAILDLCAIKFIHPRANVLGHTTWGPKIKLTRHTDSGIPIDFFTATEESWWNYLVCRTGPADSNTAIATAARKRGWKWEPYSEGFVSLADPKEHAPMVSERAVFEFVGLPYCEPKDR